MNQVSERFSVWSFLLAITFSIVATLFGACTLILLLGMPLTLHEVALTLADQRWTAHFIICSVEGGLVTQMVVECAVMVTLILCMRMSGDQTRLDSAKKLLKVIFFNRGIAAVVLISHLTWIGSWCLSPLAQRASALPFALNALIVSAGALTAFAIATVAARTLLLKHDFNQSYAFFSQLELLGAVLPASLDFFSKEKSGISNKLRRSFGSGALVTFLVHLATWPLITGRVGELSSPSRQEVITVVALLCFATSATLEMVNIATKAPTSGSD